MLLIIVRKNRAETTRTRDAPSPPPHVPQSEHSAHPSFASRSDLLSFSIRESFDSTRKISFEGTPLHSSSIFSCHVDPLPRVRLALTDHHSEEARQTRKGRIVNFLRQYPNRCRARAKQRTSVSPILLPHITRMPSARACRFVALTDACLLPALSFLPDHPSVEISDSDPVRTILAAPPRVAASLSCSGKRVTDSAVEMQADDAEEALEHESSPARAQSRQIGRTGRSSTPETPSPSNLSQRQHTNRRTCRATRKFAPCTFLSQSKQRNAESDSQ
ncbi:hypothetical protein ACLOJK_030792 [Asimina triloba]